MRLSRRQERLLNALWELKDLMDLVSPSHAKKSEGLLCVHPKNEARKKKDFLSVVDGRESQDERYGS